MVLVVTVIGAEVSGDTLFAVGDLARAHGFASSAFFVRLSCCVVVVVTVVAVVVVVATTARIFGSGGGCHRHRCWRFDKGILPQKMRLCKQEGLGSFVHSS